MLQKLKEKLKNINPRKVKIVTWVIGLFSISLVALGWYLHAAKDITINDIFTGNFFKNTDEINYSININSNFKETKKWETTFTWSIDVKDLEIVAKDNWLKQRISMWELKSQSTNGGILVKNFDAISDNEKVYYFLEKWAEEVIKQLSPKTSDKIKESFDSNKYIMIDNSKPLIRVLWDLAKNDLMKKLAFSLSTSNPGEFNKKHGIDKELKEFLLSDKLLDYFLIGWEYNNKTKKTKLSLNTNICKDYAPVIENIIKEVQESNELGAMMLWDIWEECSTSISKINSLLPMLMEIYAIWDVKNWNFSLHMIQSKLVDIKVVYENHTIKTWYANINNTDNSIALKINGDKDKVLSSLLKIDLKNETPYEQTKISWTITDWTGSIELNSNSMWIITEWVIKFANYKLDNYNLQTNWTSMWYTVKLIASWDLEAWNIEWSVKIWDIESTRLKITYAKDNFFMDYYDQIAWEFKLSYLNGELDLLLLINSYYSDKPELEAKLNFKNKILTATLVNNEVDIDIKWEINNIHDYIINLTEKNTSSNIRLKWEKSSLTSAKHTLKFDSMWKDIFEAILDLSAWKENGYNNIKANLFMNDIQNKHDINLDLNVDYKKGKAKYKLPKEFNEIDISIDEVYPLPNLFELWEVSKEEILAWTAAAWAGWAIAYISLQWYSEDARNSKRISDLGNIQSAILLKSIEWYPIEDMIVRVPEYEWKNIYIWDEKLVWWENYFVWTLNYAALGIEKNNFMDPNWTEYIIWYTTLNWWSYQLLAYMEDWNNQVAFVKGSHSSYGYNYNNDITNLIYIFWEEITNEY